jgi:predicted protein tyrosine phosphatase
MAWTWSLNWAIVTPQIVVGTCPMVPADLERIKAGTGVTAVLSLQHDECLARWAIDYAEMRDEGRRLGLAMARLPIRDFNPEETRRHLPKAIRSLARLQAQGHRTYVHCTAGISRAPLTIFGYLTLVEKLEAAAARDLIMTKRPESIPYWEAYEAARGDLAAVHAEAIERRADQLERSGLCRNRTTATDRAAAEVLSKVLGGA